MTVAEQAILAEQIRPRPKRVLVQRVKKPEKSPGGIVYADETRDALSQMGEVVNVGDGIEGLKRGDVVVFAIYAARPCVATSDLGDQLVFVHDNDIMATVEA